MAIAYVQTAHGFNTSSSLAVNFGSLPKKGNAIIFSTAFNNGNNTISSVTDNAGNTYTQAVQENLSLGNIPNVSIWYSLNVIPAAVTHTVTVNYSGSQDNLLTIQEFSGLLLSSALDQIGPISRGSSTTITSGTTGQTAYAQELIVVAGLIKSGTTTLSVGAGYSNLDANANGTSLALGMESQIVSNTGTYSGTIGSTVSTLWGGIISTFKAYPNVFSGDVPGYSYSIRNNMVGY